MRALGLVTALVMASVAALAPISALADVDAGFLGTTVYTTAADCPLYRAIAAGGPRNLNTVPETLSAKGYRSWEGGCRFTNIVERYKGRLWTVSMRCSEGATENLPRTEVWRKAADGSLTVTADKKPTVLIACTIEKPTAKKK